VSSSSGSVHLYLSGRTFQVVYGDSTSSTVYIPCSIPQGLVLGPRLGLYTADLEHGVSFHAFADNTQLRTLSSRRRNFCRSTTSSNCIEEVSHWLSANPLKLNADKTELVRTRSRHGPALLGSAGPSLQLGTKAVTESDQVRVLGVTLTSVGSVSRQVRCQRLCDELLLALPTQTSPMFT